LARLSATSLFLLLSLCIARAQAFGRFGYSEIPPIAGFTIDKQGFVAKYGAAERFYFAEPASSWKIRAIDDVKEDIFLGTGPGPTEMKVNLLAPGFMLRFGKGFSLNFKATSAPFLSWKEGSVGDNVPTPQVRWIAVSFKVGQPPIVLGFLDGDVSLQVKGRLGDWTLTTLQPYAGWVRVALPFGTKPLVTDSAATLGKLSVAIANSDPVWWQPAPQLKNLSVSASDTAIEATWQFDRKGAVVPLGASMAVLGAYPLTIRSKTHRLEGYNEEGPVTICDDDALTIHFPIARIPLGRALTLGSPAMDPIGTVSGFDFSGAVELAFENLAAARDLRSRQAAEDVVSEVIQEAPYATETNTNQRLPYAVDGKGIDVVAASALLQQAYCISTQMSSDDNSLLTSVGWRRDWYSWRIWAQDEKTERRAGAIAALAGALCPEPERRLEAAMLQAGLAAERGAGIFLARAEGKTEPLYLEPMWSERNSIFYMAQTPRHPSPFAPTLFGHLRVFDDVPVRCSAEAANSVRIDWTDATSLNLTSPFPLAFSGVGVVTSNVLGHTMLSVKGNGRHTAFLTPPPGLVLPSFVPPPRYEEPVN
jgi:hypothetical protein